MKDSRTNEKKKAVQGALIAALDVGSEKHMMRCFDSDGLELTHKAIPVAVGADGFNGMLREIERLKSESGAQKVVAGMEPTGHYGMTVRSALREAGIPVVYVNPSHVKATKELHDNTPSKNDIKDPLVIADLVKAGHYLEPAEPTGVGAELRQVSEMYDVQVKALGRAKNQLARWMAIHYPECALEVYADLCSQGMLALLEDGLLPEDLVALGTEGICSRWASKGLKRWEQRARRLVETAGRTVGIKEAPAAARTEVKWLVEDIRRQMERKDELKKTMEELLSQVPNADVVMNTNGLGPVMVAQFLGEVGDINTFKDPRRILKYAGLQIVTKESGKQHSKGRISKRGRKRLRHVLFQMALSLIRHQEAFGKLLWHYMHRENNPLNKMPAVIAVACKACRVLYGMMKHGTPFDPDKALQGIPKPAEA